MVVLAGGAMFALPAWIWFLAQCLLKSPARAETENLSCIKGDRLRRRWVRRLGAKFVTATAYSVRRLPQSRPRICRPCELTSALNAVEL